MLKTEAANSSENSESKYQKTQRHISEDADLF